MSIDEVVQRCPVRGVDLKWLGGTESAGSTSRYDSWRYAPSETMPDSDRILKGILDLRLLLIFSSGDYGKIARNIRVEVSAVHQARQVFAFSTPEAILGECCFNP